MFHFVAQKVTLMIQLKINTFNSYKEGSSCTNEVKKLPFMQRCIISFVAIKFLKESDICNFSLCNVFDG